MGTQLDDFGGSATDDFFGFGTANGSVESSRHSSHGGDEAKLIQDGNDQVLRNFEERRKSRDYARSQTSRHSKAPALNMNLVDWSGFPGAAHHQTTPPTGEDRKPIMRKSSIQLNSSTMIAGDIDRRTTGPRSQRRLSAGAILSHTTDSPPHPQSPSISPKLSPNGRKEHKKYRNRRHGLKEVAPITSDRATPDTDRSRRRGSLNRASTSSNHRAERRGSGSHHRSGRRSVRQQQQSGSSSSSRSKSRTRRPQTEAQKRSLSPNAPLISSAGGNRSTSPNARSRRPVAAAASSTTLDLGKDTRKKGQRGNSGSRRRSTQKVEPDGELIKKAKSLRW